ncbi:MAG: hypothetical protein AB1555_15690 [Nitrospirota bacterium]
MFGHGFDCLALADRHLEMADVLLKPFDQFPACHHLKSEVVVDLGSLHHLAAEILGQERRFDHLTRGIERSRHGRRPAAQDQQVISRRRVRLRGVFDG